MFAEAVGFEPTGRSSRPTVFKTAAFDHSARPPKRTRKLFPFHIYLLPALYNRRAYSSLN